MSIAITKADARKALDRYQALKGKINKIREEGQKKTEQVVRTMEVSGAAFLVGLVQGRTDGVEIMGVPAELLAGGVLTGLSLFEAAGSSSHHLGALGDGCLAAYAVTMGRGVGVTMKQRLGGSAGGGTAVLPVGTTVAQALNQPSTNVATSGVTLDDEEIRALAAARR